MLNPTDLMWYESEGTAEGTSSVAETVTEPVPAETTPASGEELPDFVKDPAKAYKAIQELRKESEKYRLNAIAIAERLSALESATTNRKEPETGEWQKLAEERAQALADIQSKAENDRIALLRENAALKFNLPPELASRLQGKTAEEIATDAESLAKLIPATPAQSGWQNRTTQAAPAGGPVGVTYNQLRERYYGKNAADIFGKPSSS